MTDIFRAYEDLKSQFAERDERHRQVSAVRRGDVHELIPGLFPDNLPKQVTANMVNVASRQLGEMISGLPDFSCRSSRHKSERAKAAAEKRTQIVNGYVDCSRLEAQMKGGGDRYWSFGALPVVVEADFEKASPVLRVDSPVGAYWRTDMFGRVVHYYKRWYESAADLAVKFPQHATKILPPPKKASGGYMLGEQRQDGNTMLEVAKCYDKHGEHLILPDRQVVLASAPSPLGRTPVFIAEMPKWDEESRGQFDEMLWVQVARARMAAYTMEIAHEAVNAPLVLPNDVNTLPVGSRTVLRTNNPQGIGRVPLDVPPAAFAENQLLAQEERLAARFPEAATGNIDASVITGQGISALLSTVDTQIQVAQSLIAYMLQDAASYALELDQVVFGKMEKSAEGRAEGKDYSIRYTPEKDIAGDYKVECTYGFASGMDANRGLIFMLQAQGAGLLSRETIMNQIASQFGMNSADEMARMDIESLDEALKQAMQGLAMSIPQLPQMGQDPRTAVRQIATLRDARQKGTPMHEAVMKAFEPTPEEQAAAEQQAQDPLAALMGGAGPSAGPAAPPDEGSSLSMLLAGLTPSGQPNLQASLSRMIPAA